MLHCGPGGSEVNQICTTLALHRITPTIMYGRQPTELMTPLTTIPSCPDFVAQHEAYQRLPQEQHDISARRPSVQRSRVPLPRALFTRHAAHQQLAVMVQVFASLELALDNVSFRVTADTAL